MGSAMTWDIYGGLTSVDNGTDSITYTYMGDGQRRSKTVNGVTTTYHYNNGMLLSETNGDETLRYYYDSTGKVASLVYKKGDEEERSYFYTRNVQGDITAVYRSKDSKLMGTYEYDLWGRLISITPTDKDTDGITEKNPYRYRSYYYDDETGFYYLKARYYDPQIRRFISADSLSVLMVATIDVSCKNLFAYSENNPVTSKDSSGMFAETVFDVISLTGSIVEACVNPSIGAVVNVVAEAVDLVPFVTGVGEAVRGVRAASKMAEAADNVGDVVKVADKAGEAAKKVTKSGSKAEIPLLETTKPITGKTNDHHIIPAFRGKSKPYADFIAERGIDVDQYTITVDAGKGGLHMNGIHGKGGWNQNWMQYIDDNPNATAKDIYQFAGKMLDDYGLSGYTIHPYGGK